MPAQPRNEWQKVHGYAVSVLPIQTLSLCAAFWMNRESRLLSMPAEEETSTVILASFWKTEF